MILEQWFKKYIDVYFKIMIKKLIKIFDDFIYFFYKNNIKAF